MKEVIKKRIDEEIDWHKFLMSQPHMQESNCTEACNQLQNKIKRLNILKNNIEKFDLDKDDRTMKEKLAWIK